MSDDTLKDGGPAYPQPQVSDGLGGIEYTEVEGMSLRDWFAGQALAMGEGVWCAGGDADNIAANCYEIADAMLAQRDKRS